MFQAPEGWFSHKKVFTSGTQAGFSPSFMPQSESDLERRKKPHRLLAVQAKSISSLMKRAFRIRSKRWHTPVHISWPVRHIFSTLQWHQETPASFRLISMWWQRNMTCCIRSLLTRSDLVWLIQERDPLEAKEVTTGPNPKTSTTCYTWVFPVTIKIYLSIYPEK